MTLRILSHLLEEAFTKNSIFCAVLYFIKKFQLSSYQKFQFKSPALVDLQSVSPISPKRYIYNYRESCHDKIIASVTLHVTKLHFFSEKLFIFFIFIHLFVFLIIAIYKKCSNYNLYYNECFS